MNDGTDNNSAFYRIVAGLAQEADAPPVIPPCPSWCVTSAALPAFDFDRDGASFLRTHEAYTGRIVNVEAVERSDGHGGPVTIGEPTIRVYGADFDGVDVAPGAARALAADLAEATAVLARLGGPTCPSWCAQCQPDGVSSAVNHWSAVEQLPGGDEDPAPSNVEPATISAYARKESGEPLSQVWFTITSKPEHFRSAPQARAFAQAILTLVDAVDGGSVATDAGQ